MLFRSSRGALAEVAAWLEQDVPGSGLDHAQRVGLLSLKDFEQVDPRARADRGRHCPNRQVPRRLDKELWISVHISHAHAAALSTVHRLGSLAGDFLKIGALLNLPTPLQHHLFGLRPLLGIGFIGDWQKDLRQFNPCILRQCGFLLIQKPIDLWFGDINSWRHFAVTRCRYMNETRSRAGSFGLRPCCATSTVI